MCLMLVLLQNLDLDMLLSLLVSMKILVLSLKVLFFFCIYDCIYLPSLVKLVAAFEIKLCFAGWKANPVEFDSVFNQSRHTFAFGSPDIIPIFCSALPHSTWNSYPHEYEDFATG